MWRSGRAAASYAPQLVTARRLLIRQAVDRRRRRRRDLPEPRRHGAGIGYGIAFYVISTPLAIWAERRKAQRDEPGDG